MYNDEKSNKDWLWKFKADAEGPQGLLHITLDTLLLCVARKDEPQSGITGIEALQEIVDVIFANALQAGAVPNNQKDIDALQLGAASEVYDNPEIIKIGAPPVEDKQRTLESVTADSRQFEDAKFQLMTAIADAVPAVNVDFEAQLVPLAGNKYHIKLKALTDKGKAYLPYLQNYVQSYMRKEFGNAN